MVDYLILFLALACAAILGCIKANLEHDALTKEQRRFYIEMACFYAILLVAYVATIIIRILL